MEVCPRKNLLFGANQPSHSPISEELQVPTYFFWIATLAGSFCWRETEPLADGVGLSSIDTRSLALLQLWVWSLRVPSPSQKTEFARSTWWTPKINRSKMDTSGSGLRMGYQWAHKASSFAFTTYLFFRNTVLDYLFDVVGWKYWIHPLFMCEIPIFAGQIPTLVGKTGLHNEVSVCRYNGIPKWWQSVGIGGTPFSNKHQWQWAASKPSWLMGFQWVDYSISICSIHYED